MQRPSQETELHVDEEQLIEQMNAIRNASERHVSQMHLEAERLVDWREHVRAQPLPALAIAVAAGFWLFYRKPPTLATPRPPTSSPSSSSAEKQDAQQQEFVARTTFASGAMAFVGTMAGNLLKQYVSNYVQEKLAGVQHDRNATAREESDEPYAERGSSWR